MAKTRRSPATRFLWIVAILTMLFIIGALLYRVLETQLLKWVLVPDVEFTEREMPDGRTYRDASMWIARPGNGDDPSKWRPRGVAEPSSPRASVFFVHPTSFLEKTAWNGPVVDAPNCEASDTCSQWRAGLFVRSQASAFNSIGQVWAPKYRQATFGAFLTEKDEARRALDFAYKDVLAAYEQFLREAPRDRPIILAGHSQGSFHLLRLLHERVKGSPEQGRIAAAYLIGWPISPSVDLPQLPLPGCSRAGQAQCIVSWSSFAEPADPAMIVETWEASTGLDGRSRDGSTMLCVNPLTGNAGDAADASANRGTLFPNDNLTDAEFRPGAIPARCGERGFLLIGDSPPPIGRYVLPGNNYHVYDYALFWANARADAEARLATFLGR
jgi:hypothetical protein